MLLKDPCKTLIFLQRQYRFFPFVFFHLSFFVHFSQAQFLFHFGSYRILLLMHAITTVKTESNLFANTDETSLKHPINNTKSETNVCQAAKFTSTKREWTRIHSSDGRKVASDLRLKWLSICSSDFKIKRLPWKGRDMERTRQTPVARTISLWTSRAHVRYMGNGQ